MAMLDKSTFKAESEAEGALIMQTGFGRKAEGKVLLHFLEAAYLSDLKLAKIFNGKKEMSVEEILSSAKKEKSKELPSPTEQYLIYKHIRSGGRIVRFSSHSPQYWRVYSRGIGREQERPQMLVRIVDSKWKTTLNTLEKELAVSRLMRLEFMLAYVEGKKPMFIKLGKHSFE